MFWYTNQRHGSVALQQSGELVEIMARRDSVEDEVEAARMSGRFIGIARYYDFLRAKVERILMLGFGVGEGDNEGPHGVCELDPHLAQATDPDNAQFLAKPRLPVAKGE